MKFRAWLKVALYAAFMFALSSFSWRIPLVDKAEKIHLDWFTHAVEYGVFGFLLSDALAVTFARSPRSALFAAALLLSAFYGLSDEYHQRFVPHRDACLSDVLVDTVGAAIGIFAWSKKRSFVKNA